MVAVIEGWGRRVALMSVDYAMAAKVFNVLLNSGSGLFDFVAKRWGGVGAKNCSFLFAIIFTRFKEDISDLYNSTIPHTYIKILFLRKKNCKILVFIAVLFYSSRVSSRVSSRLCYNLFSLRSRYSILFL